MKSRNARVVVDATKCDGHGICVLRCPQVFSLDAWGFVGTESAAPLSGSVLRKARSAVAACPERALSLVEVRDSKVPHGADVVPIAAPERAHSSTWQITGPPRQP